MYVLLPGITGFAMSYIFLVPMILSFEPPLPFFALSSIAATGLLTFCMASVLRGRLAAKDDEEAMIAEAVEA